MQNFEYIAPTQTMAAAQALSPQSGVTAVLAGGTDLLSLMKERIETPTRVVSLRNIRDLRGVARKGGGLRIGAMATVEELLASKAAAPYKSLVQAARGITAPQVRAMGYMMEVEHESTGPELMVGPAVTMAGTPSDNVRAAPPLGRHTDEVLGEVGVAAAEIAELRASGAVA